MGFPDGFVEEVRRLADIVRLISDHVSLRRSGASWKGLCPFHQEKTPSFNVRAEPAVFHCFGCGEGGDVFKFVMLFERTSFPEAVEGVARRFGVPVPERSFDAGPERREREQLLELTGAAAEHFRRNLWSAAGNKAREYLLGRGFQKATLERIDAGAAAESWSDLLEALKPRFPVRLLVAAGLVLEKEGRHYDRFRARAVFPIRNESGRVVAFGARSLDGSEPKYLNSPESLVYQKGRVLYGLSWAKDALRREGHLVLMEGYLDVGRALEAGIGQAAATCGTALTSGHAQLLRRFTDTILLNFDGDEAGQRATERGADLLLEAGLKVRVVELPDSHDPDSYIKALGPEAYRQRLEEAPPFMEWLIRRAQVRHDVATPSGKGAFFAALLPHLARIESPVERSAWLRVVAQRGGLDADAAGEELRRTLRGSPAPRKEPVPARPAPAVRRVLPAERYLLALLLEGAENAREAAGELEEEEVHGLATADALRAARRLVAQGDRVTMASLEGELADEELKRMLREIAMAGSPEAGISAVDCVRELKRRPLEARMDAIQQSLRTASGDSALALLTEKLEIGRMLAGL
jgi:DNA primase